ALSVDFADETAGWLLCAEPGSLGSIALWRTTDGGQIWLSSAALRGMREPAVAGISAERVLVYAQGGDARYSEDGGGTFTSLSIGSSDVVACAVASPDVVYALLRDGVAKSSDG